jgi:hypothetical protein
MRFMIARISGSRPGANDSDSLELRFLGSAHPESL